MALRANAAPLFASAVINDGAVTAANNEVRLALAAQDPLPATIQVSEAPDFSGAAWQAYTTRCWRQWRLPWLQSCVAGGCC